MTIDDHPIIDADTRAAIVRMYRRCVSPARIALSLSVTLHDVNRTLRESLGQLPAPTIHASKLTRGEPDEAA